MSEEIWKSIEGYEGLYEISSEGRVRSLNYRHTGEKKVLKPGKNTSGYLFVHLSKNGEKKNFLVHRLVAETFIPNPLNKPEVNHKTEDKTDNRVCNIEWMSHKENCNFGTRNERAGRAIAKALSKPVLRFTEDGEFVNEYPSIKEAERQTGIANQSISACCKGKLKSAGKYIWKYKNAV